MPPLTICRAGPVLPMVIEVLATATLFDLEVGLMLKTAVSTLLLSDTKMDGKMLDTVGWALAWSDAVIDAS